MSKNYDFVSNSYFVSLRELSDEEFVELFPMDENVSEEDDESHLLFEELTDESELFVRLAALLGKVIPYGQAIVLLALYACKVEGRMIMEN